LDDDLRAACLSALNIPRGICVEFAAKHTWEASGRAFLDNMAPIRHADVPDEAIDLVTDHPRFVT
jgi:hypothetical protein